MNKPSGIVLAVFGCIGAGCLLCIVLAVVFGVYGVTKIGKELGSLPGVDATASGVTVSNKASDRDLLDVKIVLHAQNITKPGIEGNFSLLIPAIPAKKSGYYPYGSFISKTGHALDPTKFAVDHYDMTYHDGTGASGSESGSI